MKRVVTLLLVVAGLAPLIWTQQLCAQAIQPSRPELLQGVQSVDNDAALQEWLNFYYLHPRPELTVSAWRRMGQAKLFSRDDMRPGVIAFYAALLRREPALAMKLVPEVHDSDSRYVLAYAAWLTNGDSAVPVLDALSTGALPEEKALLKDMTYRTPPDIAHKPITSEWDIDALWSTFYATGEAVYVERISSTLPWKSNADPVLRSVAEEARRTLVSNATGHPRVLQICEAEISRATKEQKELLAAVVADARQQANRTH